MPSYLLDKSVACRIIEALHHLDNLSYEEELVLELWRQLQDEQACLFIPTGVVNILQRFAHLVEVHTFFGCGRATGVRTLSEALGAAITPVQLHSRGCPRIALATYGTDVNGDIMGVERLICDAGPTRHSHNLASSPRAFHASYPLQSAARD